jgi:hypothetical protein
MAKSYDGMEGNVQGSKCMLQRLTTARGKFGARYFLHIRFGGVTASTSVWGMHKGGNTS